MSGGDLYVVRRWDHVPTQSDVDKAIASAPNNYVAFVVSAGADERPRRNVTRTLKPGLRNSGT